MIISKFHMMSYEDMRMRHTLSTKYISIYSFVGVKIIEWTESYRIFS